MIDLNVVKVVQWDEVKIENLLEVSARARLMIKKDIGNDIRNYNTSYISLPLGINEEDMEELSQIYLIDSGLYPNLKYLVMEFENSIDEKFICSCDEFEAYGECEHTTIAKNRPITFHINRYIEMRYEKGETMMYVGGKRFRKCMYLLLSIDPNKEKDLKKQEQIDSIDEAEDHFSKAMHGRKPIEFKIDPLEEFWGHCSNIQAWVEYDYDTRVLHRSMSFPLLKELVRLGEPKAKKYYKEDIMNRIHSGHKSTIEYMRVEGWLSTQYFSKEELDVIEEEIKIALNKS